jgi:DNA-binding transcriptional MerR regulator
MASRREPAGREAFRTRDVVELLGVSRRQLQYWAQTDLVAPSVQTPGGHGRYTFEDLVALKAAKRLIDAGVSVQRIRKSIRALRRILPTVRRPLAELVLVATGDVVLAFRDGTAFEAVSGQEWIFEVAQLQREVEDWQRSLGTLRAARRPRAVRRPRAQRRSA